MKHSIALAVAVMCTGIIWGCADSRSPISPSSSLTPQTSANRAGARQNAAPRRIDSDGDGYEDGDGYGGDYGPMPDPYGPMPDPGYVPGPDQVPPGDVPPGEVPVIVQLAINIVGTFGPAAYAPNPIQAAIGNTIVWTNNDLLIHDIILDDGTPVGNLQPGQSSAPIAVTATTAGYHCTIHPSMVGQVTIATPETAPPVDPSTGLPLPTPPADPSSPAPPTSDPYDDGYEDDYY